MRKLTALSFLLIYSSLINPLIVKAADTDQLQNIIQQSPTRTDTNKVRDQYRNPLETLQFFGIQPTMKVLEILPGRGWYTEILAPYLKSQGQLTAASFGAKHKNKYLRGLHADFIAKMQADEANYANVKTITFKTDEAYLSELADASQDMVLTFRNTHNWIRYGGIEDVYTAIHRVLKPGGILGVVQHRAAANAKASESAEKGYVPQAYLVELLKSKGFSLMASSEINANSNDTKNYPKGVWNLPPSFRDKEENKAFYTKIGESDRMTLKFIKTE